RDRTQLAKVLSIVLTALQASRAAAEATGWCYVDLVFEGLEQQGRLREAGRSYTSEIKEEVEGCLPDGWDIVGSVARPYFAEEQCDGTDDEDAGSQDGGDIFGTAGSLNFLDELCQWEERLGTKPTN
ncbi:hypothetical protein PpBr36_02056, partial [Pyricularia pennisetigena]|uniref:hypothetical protein n=1 Tax=Pyricularia pennisetigena TaxID=1578925 RepID=UPI00114EFF1C